MNSNLKEYQFDRGSKDLFKKTNNTINSGWITAELICWLDNKLKNWVTAGWKKINKKANSTTS